MSFEKKEITPPKIEFPTREKFKDYINNALTAWSGYLDLWGSAVLIDGKKERKIQQKDYYEQKVKEYWEVLFKKIRLFLDIGFEPNGYITPENVKSLLAFENKDPFDFEMAKKLLEACEEIEKEPPKPPQE